MGRNRSDGRGAYPHAGALGNRQRQGAGGMAHSGTRERACAGEPRDTSRGPNAAEGRVAGQDGRGGASRRRKRSVPVACPRSRRQHPPLRAAIRRFVRGGVLVEREGPRAQPAGQLPAPDTADRHGAGVRRAAVQGALPGRRRAGRCARRPGGMHARARRLRDVRRHSFGLHEGGRRSAEVSRRDRHQHNAGRPAQAPLFGSPIPFSNNCSFSTAIVSQG